MRSLTFTDFEKRYYRQLRKEGYQGFVKGSKLFMLKVRDKSMVDMKEVHAKALERLMLEEDTINPILVEEGCIKGNSVLIVNAF